MRIFSTLYIYTHNFRFTKLKQRCGPSVPEMYRKESFLKPKFQL